MIVTLNEIYTVDRHGDISECESGMPTSKDSVNNISNFIRNLRAKYMTPEMHFTEWLLTENYRIAADYRLALWQELQDVKDMPNAIIVSHLRLVDFPKYNKYEGELPKDKQAAIYAHITKLDKQLIYTTFIKENLTALATDTQQ